MKKFILIIVTIAFFICPSICLSSYLIELKSGSTFITNHYWEEGRQIKFYCYGGVVGIPKNFVKAIRKSDTACKEETVIQNTAKKPQPQPPRQKAEKTDNDLVDIEYYKREKQSLEQERAEAHQRYLQSLDVGDKEAKYEAARDAKKINKQIHQLKKELKEKNKGVLPEWWNE
jgi:hypothetical protein